MIYKSLFHISFTIAFMFYSFSASQIKHTSPKRLDLAVLDLLYSFLLSIPRTHRLNSTLFKVS